MPHKILCIDDDRNLCQILSKALAGEGYAVRLAHDGEEGLARFRAEKPELVLLDCLLPKRDGFGVLQAIRALEAPGSETPAIFLSGCSRTPEYLERAEALGAAVFLTKPVPLDKLLETVRKQLSGRTRAARGAAASTAPAADRTLRLEGSLAEIAFPELLHQLHGLRASGALLLRSGKKSKGLQLSDGRPVAVKSNLVSECLGNLLVRMGRIDQPTLDESLQRMKRGEGMQGQILVAMQVFSEEELANALRVQAEEKLFEVFEWGDGRFEFKRGGRLKGANSLPLERSPANIIVEGVRRRFPIQRVDAYLRAHADAVIVGGEIPFYQFQSVDLGDNTQALLERARKELRVAEVLLSDEASRRMVYAMLVAQLVELEVELQQAVPDPTTDAAAAARALLARVRPDVVQQMPAANARPALDPLDEGIRRELAAMAERMRGRTYYEILGVGSDPSDEDVRRAYVDLAKRTHPDRFSGHGEAVKKLAEEVFGLVSRAHENLLDRRSREAYRLELARGEREQAALEEGQRALQAEKHFQQGEAALRAKRYAAAFDDFRKAVELYPEEGDYLAHLGWTRYLTAGHKPEAREESLRALKRAAKLAPDSEKPYLFLGLLHKAEGDAEKAERLFVKAVQLKSDCLEALRELRLINLRREKQKGLVRKLLRR